MLVLGNCAGDSSRGFVELGVNKAEWHLLNQTSEKYFSTGKTSPNAGDRSVEAEEFQVEFLDNFITGPQLCSYFYSDVTTS